MAPDRSPARVVWLCALVRRELTRGAVGRVGSAVMVQRKTRASVAPKKPTPKPGLTFAELRALAKVASAQSLLRAAARSLRAGRITADQHEKVEEWAITKADAV